MAARTGWLRHIPPWRMPHIRHRHHHRELHEAVLTGLGWIILVELVAALWLIELEIWALIWVYYGMFLGIRQLYRANPIGRAASTPVIRPAAAVDPNPMPIDLAQWDGPTRRRT